jgi:hypothetical protein
MASEDLFDIMLQFHETVIQDLQARVLNLDPSTNLWIKSPFSRRIEQPIPPLEIKACWNDPKVSLKKDIIELSAELDGGARQIATGRILTLDGKVSARQKISFAIDTNDRPYACVEAPSLGHIRLRDLDISYLGCAWPKFLAPFDPAKEATLLRPILATHLFELLAELPLTYMPTSFPLAGPTNKRQSAERLPVVHVHPAALDTSVFLGLMLNNTPTVSGPITSLLPAHGRSNTALSISTQGLNTLLMHLCQQGHTTGQFLHSHLGQIQWRWETLLLALHQHVIDITGILVQQGVSQTVFARVQSQLVKKGCLRSTLLSSNMDALTDETLLASWNELLKRVLRARVAHKQDQSPHDAERLFQCFALPGTARTIETVAQELLMKDGQLIVTYIIPESLQEIAIELPPPEPAVTLTQSSIPQQTAPGAPVTIELQAQFTSESTPPYDYAWTTDPNPDPQFGPTLAITAVPIAPPQDSGIQTLTTAHLKVIDMFGQVVEAEAPARYLPAPKPQPQESAGKKGSGIGGTLLTILVIIIVLGFAQGNGWLSSLTGGGSATIRTTIGGELLSIMARPGHACQTRDNHSQPLNRPYMHPGRPRGDGIFFKTLFRCSGTYENGRFSYTETVTSDEIVSTLNTQQHCVPTVPFVYIQLDGTVNGTTVTGTYRWTFPACPYSAASAGLGTSIASLRSRDGGQGSGSWTGQITKAAAKNSFTFIPTPTPTPSIYAVAWDQTVYSSYTYTSNGQQRRTSAGNHYMSIAVTISNLTSTARSFNPHDTFSLYSDGTQSRWLVADFMPTSLTIQPQGYQTFTVVFVIPDSTCGSTFSITGLGKTSYWGNMRC